MQIYQKNEEEEAKKEQALFVLYVKRDISERRGRFGIFYSCSNYPDCKYAIKSKTYG